MVADQPPVGHETPADFAERIDARAEIDGAAGLPDELTVASDAPPVKEARASARVRIGVARAKAAAAIAALRRTIVEAPQRATRSLTEAVLHHNRVGELGAKVKGLYADLPSLEAQRDAVKRRIEDLPLYRSGIVPYLWLTILALGGVGIFDVAVLKSALNQTALDTASIWITTIGVALLFAVLNEAFGLLIALIIRKAGFRRPAVIFTLLFTGLAGTLASVAMLGWFRHEVAIQQNDSLNAIASGNPGNITFIIDPLFLAPLQAVGCLAAIVVVALYVLGGDWRRLRAELGAIDAAIAAIKVEIREAKQEADATRHSSEAAFLRAFDIHAQAAGAGAAIKGHERQLLDTEAAEHALGEAMVERYRGERNYVKGIYDNGKVRRCAMPTKFSWRRAYTPAPSDVTSDDQAPPASSNGHSEGPIDRDQLSFAWKGD